METCVAPLLGWIVSGWQGTQRALALDATTLGQCFVVLAIRVVSRGCAIPVAWVILPAGATRAWRRAWLRLLRPALPPGWPVSVLAERGVDAPWLCRRITRLGWPPFVRINTGGSFRPAGAACWRPLTTFAPRPGTRWRGAGLACTRTQVVCTLLARWEDGAKDPWLILTDLPPEASAAGWYGRRVWIEQGLKITKRAGWPWHRTRRSHPERAARLGLAVAGATVWWRRVGGATDETRPARTRLAVTARCPERPRSRRAPRLRLVRVLRQGGVALVVALRRQEPVPQGRFVPAPWPAVPAWEDEGCEPALA